VTVLTVFKRQDVVHRHDDYSGSSLYICACMRACARACVCVCVCVCVWFF
jgi:hypothetical protein